MAMRPSSNPAIQGPQATLPLGGANPSPEERAETLIRRLEQFIREGKSPDGIAMPFRKWQEMAYIEIAEAIRDAERIWRQDQRFVDRFFMVGAAALVTLGMWGTALAFQAGPDRRVTAFLFLGAGATVFFLLALWGIHKVQKYYRAGERRRMFRRVRTMDARLRALEKHLEKRLDRLEEIEAEIGERETAATAPRGET
ncbi:MAG: hypothetical protein H7841_09640 [Magnetospirillum sp. WYHS-4]